MEGCQPTKNELEWLPWAKDANNNPCASSVCFLGLKAERGETYPFEIVLEAHHGVVLCCHLKVVYVYAAAQVLSQFLHFGGVLLLLFF